MPWITVSLSLMLPVFAAQPSPSAQAALELLRLESELEAAAEGDRLALLERRVELDGTDGRWWSRLARERRSKGDLEGALEALRRAMDLGAVGAAAGDCRAARWLAGSDPHRASAALEGCIEAGFRDLGRLARDPELAPLRGRGDLSRRLGVVPPERCRGAQGWRVDLAHLMAELRRVHWLYRHRPLPRETLRRAEALEARLADLGDPEVVVALQGILASLGDGHSVLFPMGMGRGSLGRLPLGLWSFHDGLFVVRAEGPQEELLGSEVVKIGGVPASELMARMARLASHDNPSGLRWVAPVYLTFEEYLEAAGADLERGMTFRRAAGGRDENRRIEGSREPVDPSRLVLSLPAPPGIAPPLHLSRPETAFWSEYLEEGLLYVQINRIGDGGGTLAGFAVDLRRRLEGKPAEGLILDLRHNPGGDAGRLPELVRTLVAFDIRAGEGGLIVLMGRNTFSAAQTLLNDLERLTSAVFVGEPPGTRPNRLGNEAPFRLPCSGALGTLSSGYNQGATSRDQRRWIPPDVPVKVTSKDYFEGRDPELEVARILLRSQAETQTADP